MDFDMSGILCTLPCTDRISYLGGYILVYICQLSINLLRTRSCIRSCKYSVAGGCSWSRFRFSSHASNSSAPRPPNIAPNQSPFPFTLHPTPSLSLPPTHPLNAFTTAEPSSLGTRTHKSRSSTFKKSIGMAVPVRPRNCCRAEVRWARKVRMSTGSDEGGEERRVRCR